MSVAVAEVNVVLEGFTDRARKTVALASQEAHRFNHELIGTEHLLLGLVKEGAGVGATTLKHFGFDLEAMRDDVRKLLKEGPGIIIIGSRVGSEVRTVCESAAAEARALDRSEVNTGHLLLG